MNSSFLEFERPIADLEAKIRELRGVDHAADLDIDDEIRRLDSKLQSRIDQIFSALTPWQVAQLSRHPLRPHCADYIRLICSEFHELHGDRSYADDPAIIAGLARIGSRSVMLIGQQKGRGTKEKIHRNFGMPRPEGYRKALRLMQTAECFNLPVVTLIDTPGAYPGIGAEERGQSEAIAKNLKVMARLKVPLIATVIGEGGSGGALAIGVGDRINMLQYAIYSVISPEGCASILWKSADRAEEAATSLGITAQRLQELGLIDRIIPEAVGGAHRDAELTAGRLRETLLQQLDEVQQLNVEQMLERRYQRLMAMGSLQQG
ncbi:MAG: acetyl-CoA carboxylase carboxyltransferase subunit alpha [Gammaproteobacteria bacterium]|jgi:acetyl-CoA carboxylase carboxyl transferase subunit alpha|nr:acetyl-CoA carboxylase carboxyltransferase subunit alpha [Gammaproteobacteria bacterium]